MCTQLTLGGFMKKFVLLATASLIFGYSSVGMTCIPSHSKKVIHQINFFGNKELVADVSGGPGHTTVYIEVRTNEQGESLEWNQDQLAVFAKKKMTNGTLYTFHVKGSGSGEILLKNNKGVVVKTQSVVTKVLPTTRGC